MIRKIAAPLLVASLVYVQAEEVVPGSLQEAQAQTFFEALEAKRVTCSKTLLESENTFLCATTSQDAETFRAVVDANTADLKPIGPWASYTGRDDQQRSFLYKDGFMTVTHFPSDSAAEDSLMVFQYVIPHD
jgi:restriction endonuclease Mrr